MKFVEENRGDARQLRIVEDHAGKNAFGHYFDPGLGRYPVVESHAIADGFAHFLAE